ncbi:hypothetical protein [Cellulosimicrobium funkei]|uniref:hypothetical protein n=1 Tax=Cellulosimicrobium funkei TaxID=264251 RepID=UPI00341C6363
MATIDGKAALAAELDRLAPTNPVAAAAPRGTSIAAYLTAGVDAETAAGDLDGPFWRLTTHLLQDMSIWWAPESYTLLPTMAPWCIRDRAARYDQGPESWGAPNADGYFRDDNSVIKKLPLPVDVRSPQGHPYADSARLHRGFTACHIWRELADGGVGGADPWIYSFMPNLVWVPQPINSLTDHHPRVQALLKATSLSIFPGREGGGTRAYTDRVWGRLTPPELAVPQEPVLDADRLAYFAADEAFVRRRLGYLDKVVDAVDHILAGQPIKRIFASRFTAGLPLIPHDRLRALRSDLGVYAAAVRAGL